MKGLPVSPPLTDNASSRPASLVLLSVVISTGIVGTNVLSRCIARAGGAFTLAIFRSNFVTGHGALSSAGSAQIFFMLQWEGISDSMSKVICGNLAPSFPPSVGDVYAVSGLSNG